MGFWKASLSAKIFLYRIPTSALKRNATGVQSLCVVYDPALDRKKPPKKQKKVHCAVALMAKEKA